ncbi:serine/threonine-protein kinase 31 isoform X4 [Rhineura floridana]|uniref:serine/threonine-protein kinase 31 isoform X4 n=1 Tax=Rhineura floridana TaxID=261503 RepID=UPI002AC828AB|nr:serine/threonine-protein kinase 31 isoform X4 [Rhineura floridana]
MEEDLAYNKVETVVSCHVEDAVTFWAQNINRHSDILKTGCALAEICPQANPVFGNPDLTKIYGGCFSEDKCWYRCKVLKIINDEKCRVLYIDYGNSEVLSRSEIVEIPENLQFPSAAKKYRLWGLQISINQDLNQFDQGRMFLNSLIFEKEIKIKIKATYQDGTIVTQVKCGQLDVGEEMAKKGFAERCKSPINSNTCDTKMDSSLCQSRNAKSPAPVWASRANPPACNRAMMGFGNSVPLNGRNENNAANHTPFIKQDSMSTRFGEDLSEAVKVVTEEYLAAPLSLEKLDKIWIDYNSSQQEIRLCKHVDEVQNLILHRNEVRQKLYSTVEEFIMEVDDLPLLERLETVQKLQTSLEVTYGQVCKVESCEGTFEKFSEWKNVKLEEFNHVRNATDASVQNLVTCFSKIIQFFDMTSDIFLKSKDVAGNLDEVLKNAELDVSQELDIFLTELDEADKKIILNVYCEVTKKINQENNLLNTVYHKYLDSVEFKQQIGEWLESSPNIDVLLLIKKRMKNLKAQLRWKLVEKNNLEESDDYSESEMTNIKEEITGLRNNVFEEIYNEQEEYEKLNHLVQKWFPELPLLHPDAGILKYMNSGGLLTVSLERDLLDAEPMRELSTKRPLVCSDVQGQKVLLKGYAVDRNTETGVIERAAKYHRVWGELKEESGLMQLMFLFLCKADPLAYLMVPYYAGASLGMLQTTTPLTPEETLKVMKGVARGLHTLHKAGIIHGSLHKNNIFAVNREQGIVGDFDFTKSEGQRASMNSVLLNGLNLISPEVRQGQPPSPASDMYAFGCLLYWLFIGKQEFKIKGDGTPQVDGLNMDGNVKSLLTKLLCCNSQMTSEQVLNDDCFLLPEVTTVPLEAEPTECENGGARTENEIVSDDRQDNETEPFSEDMDLNSGDCV